MYDLIEALQIFAKYQGDLRCPTHCEHDVMYIMKVGKDDPSPDEQKQLNKLGFTWLEEDDDCWGSFRFGSA